MREASTDDRTWEIIEQLHSSQCKAQCVLEYMKDGAWVYLQDLDTETGLTWNEDVVIDKTGKFSLLPKTSSLKFKVINIAGKYSEGSGTDYEGDFDLGTRLRLKAGYILDDSGSTGDESYTLSGATKYYIKDSSTSLVVDMTGGENDTVTYFDDLFETLYDSETYDDSHYTPAAAFILNSADFLKSGYTHINNFMITADNTNGTIYYRLAENTTGGGSVGSWINAGATENGTKTISVKDSGRYLQIGVIYDGIGWDGDQTVSSITVNKEDRVEWIYRSCFLLDTPSYDDPKDGVIPSIACTARDAWKRAISTDYNSPDISAGVAPDTLIKAVLDIAGIEYTASSIADLSAFGDLTNSYDDVKKCSEVLENIMQWITQYGESRYRMYLKYDATKDDNVCYVEKKPTAYEAVFVQNYRYYEKIGSRKRNYDKMLQRVVAYDEEVSRDSEILLNGTQNFTSTGDVTYSWINEAGYKRVTYDSSGSSADFSMVIKECNTSVTSGSTPNIVFTITGTTIDVDIKVYGCEWSASDPIFEGEYINLENQTDKKGVTVKIENPYFASGTDAEVKKFVEAFGDDYGTPSVEIGNLQYPYLNLIDDLNDPDLIWSKLAFTDDIFAITGKQYKWSENPGDMTTYKLIDTGLDFSDLGDIIYDEPSKLIQYDNGFVYDMKFGPQATDAEIEAGTVYEYDV